MASREYEIISRNEIDDIKKELAKLKKGGVDVPPDKDAAVQDDDLDRGIHKLTNSINMLTELLKTAGDSMTIEDKEFDVIAKKIEPLTDKVGVLAEQNKKIAQAIISVVEMIKQVDDNQRQLMQKVEEIKVGSQNDSFNQMGPMDELSQPSFGQPAQGMDPVSGMTGGPSYGSPGAGTSMSQYNPAPAMPPMGRPAMSKPPLGSSVPPSRGMPPPPPPPKKKGGLFGLGN